MKSLVMLIQLYVMILKLKNYVYIYEIGKIK